MSQKPNEELMAGCARLHQKNEYLRKLLKLDLHQSLEFPQEETPIANVDVVNLF